MNKKHIITTMIVGFLFVSNSVNAELQEGKYSKITIYQIIQRVLERYPSLKIAGIEVSQAAQQRRQVESSLGWVLDSSIGLAHDLTGIGTPSDRLDITSSINRQLMSGATVSLSGGYRYEDSSLSFSPALPNPAHTSRLDLSYRFPLFQGNGNPLYAEGLISADASHELAKANLLLIRISLAEKVRDLFYTSLLTLKRIESAKQSVKRTKSLALYISKNMKLGLSEIKDKLQIDAQLHSKLAELNALQVQWKQLKTSLNRLMLKKWNSDIKLRLFDRLNYEVLELKELISITGNYHPLIKVANTMFDIAQSKINTTKDVKKDNLDLIMSIGTRTSNGDSVTGTVSEQDWAGTVSLQYKHLFDNKAVNSKYQQALLEKNIALLEISKANDDISYTVSSLSAEIHSATTAVKSAGLRLKKESLKLKEAEMRFRNGRVNTAQLIQFQNEHSIAELAYQIQKVDLNKRVISLQIYSGQFWDNAQINDNYGTKK